MYAIVRTGGKQYRVAPGDVIKVEKLDGELGTEIELSEVLFLSGEKPEIGKPLVSNAKVMAVITEHGKGAKVLVFKKKRRKGYRKMQGHRQSFTEIFVTSITDSNGSSKKTDKTPMVKDPKKKVERLAKLKAKGASAPKKKRVTPSKKKTAKKATASKKAKKKVTKKRVAKKAAKKTKKKTK